MSRYRCSCCGFFTLPDPSPGSLEICEVCYWQDDMVGSSEPTKSVGPNAVSLNEARENFVKYGASEPRFVNHVRGPRAEERSQ